MDGNGRWATRRGLPRIAGHDAGELAITATVDAALAEGIGWLTLFAFSSENWGRPQAEVDFLMDFNRRLIEKHGDDYDRRGIRMRYLGRQAEPIPAAVRGAMHEIETRTAKNSKLTLSFAFNHGGRAELVDAVRTLLEAPTSPHFITEHTIAGALQFADMPDPDLIIRTSGEYRLSNFMLWRAAYSELVFTDVLWPDFRGSDFREALEVYAQRGRRFGGVVESATPPVPEINARRAATLSRAM
jgi:undecaprenyl diphosphate synthase